MMKSAILVCLIATVCLAELKDEWFEIPETFSMRAAPPRRAGQGPKGQGASGSFTTAGAPCPKDAAIIYWAEWTLVDPENNNKTYPQGDSIFFHHIMLYDRGHLVTGSSDERSSFGPQFADDSKYAWMTDKNTLVKGSMYVVNFVPRNLKFKIRYRIKYYEKAQMPQEMRPAELRAFFTTLSLPSALKPGGVFPKSLPMNGLNGKRLVSMVGHGHIGGISINVLNGDDYVATSTFKYHDGNHSDTGPRIDKFIPAFIELPRGMHCQKDHPLDKYPALRYIEQWDRSSKPYDQLPVLSTKTRMLAKYDMKCQWEGCHAQAYCYVA